MCATQGAAGVTPLCMVWSAPGNEPLLCTYKCATYAFQTWLGRAYLHCVGLGVLLGSEHLLVLLLDVSDCRVEGEPRQSLVDINWVVVVVQACALESLFVTCRKRVYVCICVRVFVCVASLL